MKNKNALGVSFLQAKNTRVQLATYVPTLLTIKLRIVEYAKNKLQKEVKPTVLTGLKGLKVSPFNELWYSKGVKVKPLIDQNNFVE